MKHQIKKQTPNWYSFCKENLHQMEGRLIYSLYADEGIDEIRNLSYKFKIFK